MTLTILLAQVMGLYLIIGGAAIMLRQRHFIPVLGAFVEDRLLRVVVGAIELIAGLFIVVSHMVWTPLPAALVTFFGWLLVIEGTCYFILSDEIVDKFISHFKHQAWFVVGGVASILLGIYLAGFGFSWF